MRQKLEKPNDEIVAGVEDSLIDALNMVAPDLADDYVKKDFYKGIQHAVRELLVGKRIHDVVTQSASEEAYMDDNVDMIVSKMETKFFDSTSVISVMVERL